jgi:hypothetical protein
MLFLFVLFFLFQAKSQTSFDINDPRNPNCPCHKYQKLADEEYAKLIRAGNKGIGEFVGKANSHEDKIRKTRFEKYRKQKRRKHDKRIREPRWLYEFKHCGLLKKPKHLIKCPVWNDR